MRTVAVVLLLVLAGNGLAGCGGGGSDDTPTKKPIATATTTKAAEAPTVAAPTGTAAPEALSQFQCAKDAKGVWNASGTIANSGKAQATFQVTVHVGEAAGAAEQAMTKQLSNVAEGGSVKFALVAVPAPKAGGTCHVQVLRR